MFTKLHMGRININDEPKEKIPLTISIQLVIQCAKLINIFLTFDFVFIDDLSIIKKALTFISALL